MTNNNKAPSSPPTLTPSSSSSGVPMNDENIFKQNVAAARGVHHNMDNLDSIVVLAPKQCSDPSIEAAAAVVTHRNLVNAAKQRIIAPLTRANLKRCHKNFAKLDLNAEYQSKACLLGASTSTTTTNSETTSLYGSGVEGGGGLNEQLSLLSTNPSKLTTTKSPTTKQKRFKKFLAEKQQNNEDAQQQQQQQTIMDSSRRSSSLSGRRTRTRRLQFFKRSTSRFSSKSSPG